MSNSSITEEDIAPFDTITAILVLPMTNLTVMLYVYGVYTVLFIISLRILIRRRDRQNRILYIFFTIALFTFTTALNTVNTFSYAEQATRMFTFTKNQDWASFLAYLHHDNTKTIILGFELVLPLCLVITADLMLLYRCYVIWGSSKRIAFPLIFLMFSLTICEIVASALQVIGGNNATNPARWRLYVQGATIDEAFWVANMGINIILTLLTAGRIWWISREARKHLGPASKIKYNMVVAVILESGIIYPIFLIAATVVDRLANPDHHNSAPFSVWNVTYQVTGIAPTLIIIRAAGGKTIEHTSMKQTLSGLHFANGAGAGSGDSDTRSRVQTVDVEANPSAERMKNLGEENAA
ncbi:hypothetical protein Moror_9912 [Moniliophthora roreri MCA 2997]|uniref:Uncharacterized protein n=1 Tax=Moniliophthora roreri (strain MCA 2997) TaxID=1381753 RepID=V2WZU3_MONRO|nr:hypothetical protein Moror_9912 [Moniliophthora roreri MCA 2997]